MLRSDVDLEKFGFPTSTICTSFNGRVSCTIASRKNIQVYVEPQGAWYSTTACGGGWIHESQIRFNP